MKLLDLYCKAGGAAKGYTDAGFEVVGVDIEPQPNYPYEFRQCDAIEYLNSHWREFDAAHASPPCQVHSVLAHLSRPTHVDWIPQTRAALIKTGLPYVIENVPGAPLLDPIILCGSHFGLKTLGGAQLRRHRLFETNINVIPQPACNHYGETIGIFGDKARNTAKEKRHYTLPKETRGVPVGIQFSLQDAQMAMGIDWMGFRELSQAIPPAYTEYIGKYLLQHLGVTA
jgi:DNA (cytosine-5)-methyltransferase 1